MNIMSNTPARRTPALAAGEPASGIDSFVAALLALIATLLGAGRTRPNIATSALAHILAARLHALFSRTRPHSVAAAHRRLRALRTARLVPAPARPRHPAARRPAAIRRAVLRLRLLRRGRLRPLPQFPPLIRWLGLFQITATRHQHSYAQPSTKNRPPPPPTGARARGGTG